ncbi:MAG: ribonuclease R [Bacillota bacterium]|nr:ribonuclease R [Bacillota bacterium]
MLNREKILEYLRTEGKPVYETQIFSDLNITKENSSLFNEIMNSLEYTGKIIKTKKNKYALPEKMGLTLGKVITTPKGFGFVREEGVRSSEHDIFIPSGEMKTAMEGDLVYARILEEARAGRSREGTIVKIIKRNNTTVVGTFEKNRNFGFLIPDNPAIYNDILIKKKDFLGAKNKDKVVVKISKWGFGRSLAEGKIIEVIGSIKDSGVDVLSVIRKYKLNEEFPKKVMDEAYRMPVKVADREFAGREDYTEKNIVTIDGIDTKDIDDAIGLEIDQNGNFVLGVHIADVTNYVKYESKLDKEAFSRGNSVYLIDKVLPMLPKTLSNGICSLNEGVNRLAVSVIITLDKNGKVLGSELKESVIRSRYKLNYPEVSAILDAGVPDPESRIDEKTQHMLLNMHELAQILRQKREERGALDFDFKEPYIELDLLGTPVNIRARERGSGDKLIEEFMIKANEVVAEYAYAKNLPFVYRIHEQPDMERLSMLNHFTARLGYKINIKENKVDVKDLQGLLTKLKGTPEEKVVSRMLLRSLKQARYSPICMGHLGLASQYYCHFTSPIRRYADLQIHRMLKMSMRGEVKEEMRAILYHRMEMVSENTSETERIAESAEREVDKLKMCQYMEERIGEEYEAVISTVNKFGIYSELDNTIEGFTKVSALESDYYIFDENSLSFVGDRTGKRYGIGDKVRVQVESVDVDRRFIDFLILD